MIQQSCATCDVNKNKAFSKCINRFVSVRLFPYLPVWFDWFCELCLHAKPIRDATNLLCGTVRNRAQFFVIVKGDGIDNDVIMD